jgi:tRNA 2-thiouridine synthesizing protein C
VAQAGNKTVLLVLRHSPYGSSLAKASVDVALATAAFSQAIDLLFLGDGVLQLMPDQHSRALGMKNVGRQLASLPLYDINYVYVDAQAVTRYNMDLSKAPVDTRALDQEQMHRLMVGYDHLLGL